jgi:poly(3-hydroxybutyrate) depolymerase
MKHWMKCLALMLALLMALAACAPADDPAATDDETPSGEEQEDVTPAPLPVEIFKDGTTDYKLVFDDSNKALSELVYHYVDQLKNRYDITLEVIKASRAETVYDKEIIVGAVRPAAETIEKRMRVTGDFAICLVEDDLVLCATDDANYRYLFDILMKDKTYLPDDGSVSLSTAQDLIYHESTYAGMSYAAYRKQKEGTLSQESVVSMFSYGQTQLEGGGKMVYRLYVPSNYTKTEKYPLLVLLHGAGERGVDNEKHMCYMLQKMFNHKDSPLMNAIILVPQCPDGQQWVDTPWANGNYSTQKVKESNELAGVLNVVDELIYDYMIDEDRIYAMGLSMGGFGTWDLLSRHGDMFAAGVPICGGGDPSMADELADIPIYTFHGSADTIVPVAGTREMAEALEAAGSSVFTYEELDGMGHGIWETVADRADVVKWLFSQTLANR